MVAILPSLRELARSRSVAAIESSSTSSHFAEDNQAPPGIGGRRPGRIVDYFEDRSYGYIRPEGGNGKVFFHKSEVGDAESVRLRPSLQVTYVDGKDRQGRACAKEIQIVA